ncbi:MAG TPA: hypothetical protein PLV41_02185 [Miltoncostaeales bacterium]|jgi:hypothetical protein|nr:hypothetical protein [Miltoncostaeales bacterium]
MRTTEHVELTDDERAMYSSLPVSDRTSRVLTWALGLTFGGIVVFMVLAATVFKGSDPPGVSYNEIEGQPIYLHQPPQSTDVRIDRGSAAATTEDSARRYVVRRYVTRVTPKQARDYYLRQFGVMYAIGDVATWDTDRDYVLRGTVALSERTTADPPNLAVRIAIGKELFEERTQVTLSIESDF